MPKQTTSLLFLAKRRPQSRDLVDRPYGRFYHLPLYLAQMGFKVSIVLLDFQISKFFYQQKDGIDWYTTSHYSPRNRYYSLVRTVARTSQPAWIVGFSDIYYGILAQHLATTFECRSWIDAYDNYEAYKPRHSPLHWLWRRTLPAADLLTAPGHVLLDKMDRARRSDQRHVLPMCADPLFKPADKAQARKQLSLPQDRKLIGYCGSLDANRGVETMFTAFDRLMRQRDDVDFVFSGRKSVNVVYPENAHVLGYIQDADMPTVFNALDVLISVNDHSAFGDYSYPVKLYEALACQVPVIATATRSVSEMLGAWPEFLCPPQNPPAMAAAIHHILDRSNKALPTINTTWQSEAQQLGQRLSTLG